MGSFSDAGKRIELWGGVECTVNRVGDTYFDQLKKNRHDRRLSDLDLFAQLGISAIRYPVLWERIAPHGLKNASWPWADERLKRLRELQLRPIVGLVHHGSGPRETSLIDPAFPEKLAEYAAAVAERYPWVDAYTPINEPVTTARFSGLYGFWYPHGRDARTFALALVGQSRATVLAMKAIRQINPNAQLIQTEDLGKVHSTPALRYQAEFENERAWLGFDLLCGRVQPEHPLWSYLLQAGIEESQLYWFQENNCPPDIMGFNYYLTSERFFDERYERYPGCVINENGRHIYANIEAVRVCAEGCAGPHVLMQEAWERYQLPLALTEVHLGCTREEQLRWFLEVWEEAQALQSDGVDMRAVTAWSLLGSYDWNSLVTCDRNFYEPGVFDLRGGHPRPTAMVRLLQTISEGREFEHPVIETPGWWRKPARLISEPVSRTCPTLPVQKSTKPSPSKRGHARPLLITGATGTLGRAFAHVCDVRGLAYRLLSRREMDIADSKSVKRALAEYNPWAVINTAGYVRVDSAEHEPETCFRENTEGAAILAAACEQQGISYLTFSSDLVFDGELNRPYVESDQRRPLNVYGQSKAKAETLVQEINPKALVIRTSAFFGPWDQYNFLRIALGSLAAGKTFSASDDCLVSPTYVPDLVNATLDLLIDAESGLWHLANQGALTWAEFARWAAELAGFNPAMVIPCPTSDLKLTALRPAYSVLGSERGLLLPTLEHSLERFIATCASSFQD